MTKCKNVILLLALFLISFAACGTNEEAPPATVQNVQEPEHNQEEATQPTVQDEPEENEEPVLELVVTEPEPEPELTGDVVHHITFSDDDWDFYNERVTPGAQVFGERVTDFGNGNNYALRLTNTTGNYGSAAGNLVMFMLPEILVQGGTYRASWDVFVPSDRNHDKSTIPGPGLVFNSNFGSPASQPTNAFDMGRETVMDEWITTSVDFFLDHGSGAVNHLVYRFRVNEEDQVPTVWYIDNIKLVLLDYTPFVEPEWDLTLPSLQERWADYFLIGSIMEPPLIRNNPRGTVEMFLHHYGAVTAENAMKPDAISGGRVWERPSSLNLGGAEEVVRFAEENNLVMVGHTLAWHSQSSPWLNETPEGEPLTRAEAKENLRWFIENYAGHFEGRVHYWDVTNEVLTGGGSANIVTQAPEGNPVYDVGTWQRALRNYVPWYRAFSNGADFEAGESATDYVYYAFVFARRYAPSARLIYNDYNEWFFRKREAIANMTIGLNERWHNDSVNNPAYGNPNHPDYGRLLIEVIGMQGHVSHNTDWNDIYRALNLFSTTGARIHITEFDLTFADVPNGVMTPEQEHRQAEQVAQLFYWFRQFSDYIDRISIWGREDSTSWRSSAAPLHFNGQYQPKKAFWAMIDPDAWLP